MVSTTLTELEELRMENERLKNEQKFFELADRKYAMKIVEWIVFGAMAIIATYWLNSTFGFFTISKQKAPLEIPAAVVPLEK